MLLDFTVENFRSIKGAETLSAVAVGKSKGKSSNGESGRRIKSDDEIAPPFHIEGWDLDVLPVLAIFGANASGKSNVLKALEYLLGFMSVGSGIYGLGIESKITPFKLDKLSRESPSHFILRTAFNGTIYTYSLKLNNTRILSEKLEYTLASTKRERLLFSRMWNEEDKKINWKNGSDFSGSHIQLEKGLQEREPLVSLFPKLEIEAVKPLADWLTGNLGRYLTQGFINAIGYMNQNSSPEFYVILERVKNLLLKFDTGLYDIKIRKIGDDEGFQIYAFHKTEEGKIISWKFEEESIGTQHLFRLALNIQLMFLSNSLVIVDELGSNIHPNIIREIVRLFQNPKTNPNRTQLIFTSHDNTLQRNNLLRRDQIWFTQKRDDQSTELYPLSDFKVRNDLAIDKAYLDGRFRAIPFILDDEDLMPMGNGNG
jgi:uncharacterized protein